MKQLRKEEEAMKSDNTKTQGKTELMNMFQGQFLLDTIDKNAKKEPRTFIGKKFKQLLSDMEKKVDEIYT